MALLGVGREDRGRKHSVNLVDPPEERFLIIIEEQAIEPVALLIVPEGPIVVAQVRQGLSEREMQVDLFSWLHRIDARQQFFKGLERAVAAIDGPYPKQKIPVERGLGIDRASDLE